MESNERKKKKITLTFYEDEWPKILRYYLFILGCINKKKKVPSAVMANLYAYFEAPEVDEITTRKQRLASIKNEVLDYFNDKKSYNFSVEQKINTPDDGEWGVIWAYDFRGMLDQLFHSFLLDKSYKTTNEKATIIPFTYAYFKQYFSYPEHKQIISDYALIVITGFIAARFGRLKTEEEFNESDIPGLYTQYLHKQAEYLCKKSQGNIK